MVHSPFSFLSGSPFAPKVRTVLVGEPSSSSPWAHPKVLAPDYAANSEPQDDGVTPMATGAAPSETAPPPAPLPTPPPSAATAGTVAAAVPPSQPLSMAVGARVRTEFGDEGVVRFVGQTSFREGEWIGVELLRPKGKNDGTVQGVRYFESKPDHGLFARAHKLELLPADGSSPPVEAHAANDGMPPPANANANSPRPRNSPSGSSWPAPELRPTLRGMPGTQKATVEKGLLERLDRVASTDYGLEYSPWPERQVPLGWRHAWGVPRSQSSAAVDEDDANEAWIGAASLPIVIYVSSLNGDRRTHKQCRWTIDFLFSKKVPHAVIDLSVHPHERSRLEAYMSNSSPGRPTSSRRSDDDMPHLPVIDICGLRALSTSEMQDLEDHGELDPLLREAIQAFATA